jgi:hypothetical protein
MRVNRFSTTDDMAWTYDLAAARLDNDHDHVNDEGSHTAPFENTSQSLPASERRNCRP